LCSRMNWNNNLRELISCCRTVFLSRFINWLLFLGEAHFITQESHVAWESQFQHACSISTLAFCYSRKCFFYLKLYLQLECLRFLCMMLSSATFLLINLFHTSMLVTQCRETTCISPNYKTQTQLLQHYVLQV